MKTMNTVFDNNAFVGMIGTVLSLSLSQVNLTISIATGLLTFAYMVRKHMSLKKNK